MCKLKLNNDLGLLILRVGIGGMFFFAHGLSKLQGGPEMWGQIGGAMGKLGITFAPVFWGFMASAAEGIGGLLLIVGLGTRTAAAFMAFTMAVAAFHHLSAGDGLATASHAIEAAIVFLALVWLGSGKYAIKPSN